MDQSNTLGDTVVEQMARKLIETAGRLVADRNAPGSGVTAPYRTIDDTGRVELSYSQDVMTKEGVSNATLQTRSSRVPDRKIRGLPAKKVSRVIDIQKNNQLKYSFTGVPDTDPRACFNRATGNPAVNLQQPPLRTSHRILGDSRQLGKSASKFQDLLDHYGDGFRRCDDSPVVSDGEADELRENP